MSNNQLLYAILSMDVYHHGADGGLNGFVDQNVQIDDTIRGSELAINIIGFDAWAYSYAGTSIIAYRGTDDDDLRDEAPFIAGHE